LVKFFLNESKKTKDFDSKKSQRWQYYITLPVVTNSMFLAVTNYLIFCNESLSNLFIFLFAFADGLSSGHPTSLQTAIAAAGGTATPLTAAEDTEVSMALTTEDPSDEHLFKMPAAAPPKSPPPPPKAPGVAERKKAVKSVIGGGQSMKKSKPRSIDYVIILRTMVTSDDESENNGDGDYHANGRLRCGGEQYSAVEDCVQFI
jgi:hypothetical protein